MKPTPKNAPTGDPRSQKRMLLAARLKDILAELGWKKKDLAEKLGKNPSEVTKWLSGKHNFTTDTLAEIERVTGKPLINIMETPLARVEEPIPEYQVLAKPTVSTVIKYPLRNLHPEALRDLQEKYPDAEVRIELNSERRRDALSEDQFWQLIGLLDWTREGDNDAVIEPVVKALERLSIRHIYEFDDILSHKLFLLDGADFARQTGENAWRPGQYFSVDAFLYARCCAVANGREFFHNLLQDPTLMPTDLDFGPLLRIAEEAYVRKTGRPYTYVPAFPVETYSNEAGWMG